MGTRSEQLSADQWTDRAGGENGHGCLHASAQAFARNSTLMCFSVLVDEEHG